MAQQAKAENNKKIVKMGSAEQLKLKVGWTVRDPLLVGMSGLRNLWERERESSSFFLLARRWTSYPASPDKIQLTNLKKHSIGLACSYPKELRATERGPN